MTHALILADIEGVIDIMSLSEDEKASELFTKEVELYIDTLLKNGIDKITVCDAHNKGNMILPRIVENFSNVTLVSQVRNVSFDKKCDFAIMVGYHGMEGSPGILSHSYRYDIKRISVFNERLKKNIPIGEIEVGARWLGHHGVPVIFVSGDREAAYEANQFNPYRQASCIKTIFQTERICADFLREKLVNNLKSALKLDWNLCISRDDSPVFVEFYHLDMVDALTNKGYTKFTASNGEGIVFKNCAELISEIQRLADLLNQIGYEFGTINISFLKKVREMAKVLDKDSVIKSEAGPLLSTSLSLLDKVSRDKIMLVLNDMMPKNVGAKK